MDYKYKLSLCLCVKNEAKYISDFIKHYINQGVEHFYIVNNNSSDNLEEVIHNYGYDSLVTIITDNRTMNINNAYSNIDGVKAFINDNFYHIIKNETEWIIIVDIDEYMYGKNGYTIKTYLSSVNENIGSIYVVWNIINPNKIYGKISDDFSIKNNVKRLNYDLIDKLSWNGYILNSIDFGKSINRTSMIMDNCKLGLHKTHVTGESINNYGGKSDSWPDNWNKIDYSEDNYKKINIALNHYVIRNDDDYGKKRKQLNENNEQRNKFLIGIFEMLDLDDSYFTIDNTINDDHN
jgi:glycosyltransferase involved in cell wall biosynthesis